MASAKDRKRVTRALAGKPPHPEPSVADYMQVLLGTPPEGLRHELQRAARLIESGEPLPETLAGLVATALRLVAFGERLPTQAVAAEPGRESATEEIMRTGTTRGLRIAALVRLLELAEVSRMEAVRLVAESCGAGVSTIRARCKEWGIASEDEPALIAMASGRELTQVLASPHASARKFRARYLALIASPP